jgi:hypothetical protein
MKFITVEHAKKAKLTSITVTGQAFKAKCKQKYIVQMRYRKKNFIVYETKKREHKQQQITNRRGQA